jgi:hypothetical protein
MSTKIGFDVMMIEAFMGVVIFNPIKNRDWFSATPNKPQRASLIKSLGIIFSFEKNNDKAKNSNKAPDTRVNIKPMGCK